jgi:hypothetical protein
MNKAEINDLIVFANIMNDINKIQLKNKYIINDLFFCIKCLKICINGYFHDHHIIPLNKIKNMSNWTEWEYLMPLCNDCHKKIHIDLKNSFENDDFMTIIKNTKEWLE